MTTITEAAEAEQEHAHPSAGADGCRAGRFLSATTPHPIVERLRCPEPAGRAHRPKMYLNAGTCPRPSSPERSPSALVLGDERHYSHHQARRQDLLSWRRAAVVSRRSGPRAARFQVGRNHELGDGRGRDRADRKSAQWPVPPAGADPGDPAADGLRVADETRATRHVPVQAEVRSPR